MTNYLSEVLTKIGEEYQENICDDSRHYLEISLAQKAAELGFFGSQRAFPGCLLNYTFETPGEWNEGSDRWQNLY